MSEYNAINDDSEHDGDPHYYSVRTFCKELGYLVESATDQSTESWRGWSMAGMPELSRVEGGSLADIGAHWMTRDDGLEITLSDGRRFLLRCEEVTR